MTLARRTPMLWVAVGLVFVGLDFRTERLDVLADPVGWFLIAVGAWTLGNTRAAVAFVVAAAVLSLATVHLPYEFVHLDPVTGEVLELSEALEGSDSKATGMHLRFDPLTGGRLAAHTLSVLVGGLGLWCLLRALQRRAGEDGHLSTARWLEYGAWLVPVAWVVPQLAVIAVDIVTNDGAFDLIWNDKRSTVALPGVITLVGIAVFLALNARRAWALPGVPIESSPWEGLRR